MNMIIACCEAGRSDLVFVTANQDENTFLVTLSGVALYDVVYIYKNGEFLDKYIVTQDMIDNGIVIEGQDGDTVLAQTQLGSTDADTLDQTDPIWVTYGECDDSDNIVFTVDCSNLEVGDVLTYSVS